MRFATALAAVAVVAFGVTAGVARQDPIAASSKIGDLDGSRQIRVRPNARVSGQISPSSAVRTTQGDGNISDIASVLREGWKNTNNHANLGDMWGILVYRG